MNKEGCSHASHQRIGHTLGLKSLAIWRLSKNAATHGWVVQRVLLSFLRSSPPLAPRSLSWTVDRLIILFNTQLFAFLAELLKKALAFVNE